MSNLTDLRTQLILSLALLLFGFGLVAQLRSYEQLNERLEAQSDRDLVEIVDRQESEIKLMRAELTDLQVRKATVKDSVVSDSAVAEKAAKEIESLRVFVGEAAAIGPGIKIDINDRERLLTGFDLRQVIEELRSSGAWAISLNGRRVGSSSSMWRAQGDVYLDGVKLKPRYIISAVGDSNLLFQSITLPRGVRDKLDTYKGVSVGVERAPEIRVPPIKAGKNGAGKSLRGDS